MLKGKMATFCVSARATPQINTQTQNTIKDRITLIPFLQRKFLVKIEHFKPG